MQIPFVDLKSQYLTLKPEMDQAIQEIINQTAFIGGTPVDQFESAFARYYGVSHCISTANGTDSLYIIMKMLGIGTGDEVITVANSWISSSETISQTGAKPVFIDIDPVYYTIDEHLIEQKITENTKGIIPVHLYGQMCQMDKIKALSEKYDIPVIEDCAQSHFSEFRGKRAGLFGIAGSFSFYPGKNLGAYGDAGCIITNDDVLANSMRMFARHGALKKHEHKIEGINSRLDGIQAAVLSVKLPYILDWTQKRIQNAAVYNQLLEDVEQVTIPRVREDTTHSYHLYVIRCKERDQLAAYLHRKGVNTAIHYPTALPNLPAYEYLGTSPNEFPVSTAYQNEILSLPMYPELSRDSIQYICECIIGYYAQ